MATIIRQSQKRAFVECSLSDIEQSFKKFKSDVMENIGQENLFIRNILGEDVFPTAKDVIRKDSVIFQIETLLNKWTIGVANVEARIEIFGSQKLGISIKASDIDALCLVPISIKSCDFFTSFYEALKLQPEVTDCRSIESAFVPIICLKFDGIEVDLLFCQLPVQSVTNMNLSADDVLQHMNIKCVRSLNGLRVTNHILKSVKHMESFRLASRLIKLWAKSK